MSEVTATRIAEIRERVEKATMGPWAKNPVTAHVDAFEQGYPIPVCALLWPTELRTEDQVIADGMFIAHARQDIPDLLAEIDRLSANLRTVQNAAKTLADAQGSELEHLRQNAGYDRKLRSEHDSLIERDAIMTAENERLSAALTAANERAERAEAIIAHIEKYYPAQVDRSRRALEDRT